jgi:NodT family efflux transporter outer membrane factor (OMF) lipoprotein
MGLLIGAASLLATLQLACGGTKYAEKSDQVVEVPDAYKEGGVDGEPLNRWCSDFQAPQLEGLVDRAFQENLDLKASWARLKQADAAARQAGSARWPMVNAEASFNRTEQPSLPPTVEIDKNQLKASVGVNYEVDLWGKMANRHRAAKLDRQAARADVEAMAISLTTQIAENWFNLVHQRAKAELLRRQIDLRERFMEITLMRLSRGRATALDVNQQRQQVQALEGQLETIKGRQETAKHQLAILVGQPPQKEVAGGRAALPDMPPLPDTGVPSDLLQRRPDIRSALLRLKAADQRTAAAVKEQFPSISLSTSLFYQAPNLDELFEDIFWQAFASASQALFDGGRRFSEIDRAEATAEAQLYSYGKTVLTALKEVEDALVLEEQQTKFIASLRQQQDSAEQALDLARERYRRGALDYLRVLDTLQSLQSVEQTLLDARRQRFSHRLQLCRALGGSWTEDLEQPESMNED